MCDSVPLVANGYFRMIPANASKGATANLVCFPGYEAMSGPATITCDSDGEWGKWFHSSKVYRYANIYPRNTVSTFIQEILFQKTLHDVLV